jgi:hypothetical protein
MATKTKNKSKRSPKIDPKTVQTVLNAARLEDGRYLGDALEAAKSEYTSLIGQANAFLANSDLAIMIARDKGKRPSARIVLDAASGTASLQFVRREASESKEQSKGPSLADLRAKAKSLGIDPTPFGRQKSKLEEAIKQSSATSKKKA